jgi:hypothetical protein
MNFDAEERQPVIHRATSANSHPSRSIASQISTSKCLRRPSRNSLCKPGRSAAAIREHRRAAGELGPDQVALHACDPTGNSYDLALAVGDRVRLFARTNAAYATMPELPPYFANRRDLPLFCPPDT